ncbi:hypothetical protein NA57DRAFT_82315 [Rhizodiscina lignyota]|uniref:Xylanolytic transcriptional activator regulatory domain-containing protein n=1 Tax=Rhizodiscina lignyota TaxID=1504668 RepID=A0A9P4I621_9PEZI|nr:hypothetical protein NA57DRAFT_82315 [Rhizodiscina lignyota]
MYARHGACDWTEVEQRLKDEQQIAKARPACSSCRNFNIQCVYGDAPSSGTSSSAVATAAGSSSRSTASSAIEQHASPERLRAIEARLESLTGLVQAMRQSSSEASSRPSEVDIPAAAALPIPKRARQTGDEAPVETDTENGHLNIQSGGRTKYVGNYFWASICDEASKLDELLRSQNRYDIPTPTASDTAESPGSGSATSSRSGPPGLGSTTTIPFRMPTVSEYAGDYFPQPPVDELYKVPSTSKRQKPLLVDLSLLPRKPQCDYLVETFMKNYQAVAPALHVPTFLEEYESLWAAERERVQASPPYISLLYAVLFAGSVIGPTSGMDEYFSGRPRSEISRELYKQTTKALRQASFARTPSVESLTAYMIAQTVWFREEEPLVCCSFMGVAVRISQMLGLNKDPSCFPLLSPVAIESRRRLWWLVYFHDVSIAMSAGLPPLIDDASWDVKPISEVKDHFIGTAEAVEYERDVAAGTRPAMSVDSPEDPNQSSLVSTCAIFAWGKYRTMVAIKYFLSKLFQQKPMTRSDVADIRIAMEQLRSDLFSRIRRISQSSGRYGGDVGPTMATHATNPALNKWTRLSLSAMYARSWGLLYIPLEHSTISSMWADLRPSIIDYSRSYIMKFIYLAVDIDFRPFQWAWPGKYQPLHAIMILIREVDKDPYGPGSRDAREIVDEAMALCDPDGSGITYFDGSKLLGRPLTEGGHEAWELIWRLRARAWTKANVDPDVLFTREEVLERAKERASRQIGFAEGEDESERQARLAAQRERGIAILEGRIPGPSEEARAQSVATSIGAAPSLGQTSQADLIVPGGGPTPNIDWAEWENMFSGQEGGDLSYMFGTQYFGDM